MRSPPAVLLVCLTSAYRGYCQGHENMTPTTVGQVLEVLVKVIVGLVLAWYLKDVGKSLPMVSAGAIFGVTAGSLAALIYMFAYKRRCYSALPEGGDTPESSGRIFKTLLKVGIPITLGSSVLSLINLVDSGLCMGRLQDAAGFSYAGRQGALRRLRQGADALQPARGIHNAADHLRRARHRRLPCHRTAGARAHASRRTPCASPTVIALPMGVGLSRACPAHHDASSTPAAMSPARSCCCSWARPASSSAWR